MKSYPTNFKTFQKKIVQMGTLQKLQNSIETLVILWPIYIYPSPYKLSIFRWYLKSYHFAIFHLQILLFVVKTLSHSSHVSYWSPQCVWGVGGFYGWFSFEGNVIWAWWNMAHFKILLQLGYSIKFYTCLGDSALIYVHALTLLCTVLTEYTPL